jgi:secondary thiamine-phosphate synthase enzyme
MPPHIKSMLAGISLHIPVTEGKVLLGAWQGIYIAERRARPHRREVVLADKPTASHDRTRFASPSTR